MNIRILDGVNNKMVKAGLPCSVSLFHDHNHAIDNAAAMSFLRPDKALRQKFEGYFHSGMGVSESIKFHQEKLDMVEKNYADASLNPKYHQVHWWHEVWMQSNLGPRTGKEMIDVLEGKICNYADEGCHVLVERNPFAVCIMTPLMLRCQELSTAYEFCFVDSTSSCDADNHYITFLLTTSPAGAIPLAVIITQGQSESDYAAGFKLAQKCRNKLFGGQCAPQIFLTDDSDAEQAGLLEVWPTSSVRLCIFHIMQAHWRWLWNAHNNIQKDDRQTLISEFRRILVQISVDEASVMFGAALSPKAASKYQNWRESLKKYWERRELWCLAWRSIAHRGSEHNSCSAASIDTNVCPIQVDHAEGPTSLCENTSQNNAESVADSVQDADIQCSTELLDQVACTLKTKCQELHANPLHVRLFMQRLQRVRIAGQLTSFLCMQGASLPRRHNVKAGIRMQPTSISRRADGITRGAKRLPVGRPPLTDAGQSRPKLPRNLAYNISKCQPNAKSYGHQ